MKGINLSEWAIRPKSLIIYFMLMSIVAGVSAYLHLGRNEDPEFTIKTMVVQTLWPGATQEETMRQVTDRVYVMRAGRVVEEGATAHVLEAPEHPYTRTLLAAVPGALPAQGDADVPTAPTSSTQPAPIRPRPFPTD